MSCENVNLRISFSGGKGDRLGWRRSRQPPGHDLMQRRLLLDPTPLRRVGKYTAGICLPRERTNLPRH